MAMLHCANVQAPVLRVLPTPKAGIVRCNNDNN